MGGTFSNFTGEGNRALIPPLPRGRILETIFSPEGAELGGADRERNPAPVQVHLNRLILRFSISRDVEVKRRSDSTYSVRFAYSSSSPIRVMIFIGLKDHSTFASLEASLPKTENKSLQFTELNLSRNDPKITESGTVTLNLLLSDGNDECRFLAEINGSVMKVVEHYMYVKEENKTFNLISLFSSVSAESSPSQKSTNVNGTCAVCLTGPVTVGFLPCRHVCVCDECASVTMISSSNHCPICRVTVTGQIKLS